jgi:hypothetical protein
MGRQTRTAKYPASQGADAVEASHQPQSAVCLQELAPSELLLVKIPVQGDARLYEEQESLEGDSKFYSHYRLVEESRGG